MSWFGLFDHLRLHGMSGAGLERQTGPSTQGWSMPGSQLRITDRGLAALYRGAILAAGNDYRADMFDLAGHYLAHAAPATDGQFHLDARLIGRPQQLLFGEAAGPGLIAWHEPSLTATVRLPGSPEHQGVLLPHSRLPGLLAETLPVQALASLSLWVETAEQAAAILQGLSPWITSATRAVLRISDAQAARLVPALPRSPAQCAAVLPCTGFADHEGRGEDPSDLLLCLENLSAQTAADAAARLQALSLRLVRPSWNDQDHGARTARQGGVAVQMPLPERALLPSWTLTIIEDIPPTPAGAAVAALQTTAYRASCGFDYVAEVSGARLVTAGGTTFILPQDGPVLVDPARFPEADAEAGRPQTDAMAGLLQSCGVLADGRFSVTRSGPVRSVSARPAFLLGNAPSAGRYITEIWPQLEYLLRHCEQARLSPGACDILAPGQDSALVRDSLAVLGIPVTSLHPLQEQVLYQTLMVVPPASRADRAQRSAAYDQFWNRIADLREDTDFVSFSRTPPTNRFFLTGGDGPGLFNAATLAETARARGFQVVSVRDNDLPSLLRLLGGARILIGDAASLAWSVLARGCAVGALLADTADGVPHPVMHAAAARGHTLSVAFGTGIGGAASGFAVAPDLLESLIDRLERGLTREPALAGAVR